ncbi:MAG: radical SAM protein, partial [Duncaniella sp.]|nr:radical SAM protein [Duncaniella sp.]
MKPAKLYVHVPFCHAKCSYCDFYSTPRREWMEAYVDAVVNEWESRKSSAPDGIDTIYLGGGTPSSPVSYKHIRAHRTPDNIGCRGRS